MEIPKLLSDGPEHVAERLLWLGALDLDRPEIRVNLVTWQLVGLGMTRCVLRFEPPASLAPEEVVARVAPTLQR